MKVKIRGKAFQGEWWKSAAQKQRVAIIPAAVPGGRTAHDPKHSRHQDVRTLIRNLAEILFGLLRTHPPH